MNKSDKFTFAELVIYGFIKDVFLDAINRYTISNTEVDIYIPSIKCVVEIDENQCGKNKIELINKNNSMLNGLGISVIRIRESGLGKLIGFKGAVIETKLKNKGELVSAINLLMCKLSKLLERGELRKKLESYNISWYELDLNAPRFISKLYDTPVHPNVLDYAGGQLWDYELNGDLNPLNVNFQNCREIPINFICPEPKPFKRRLTTKSLRLRRWCVDINEIDSNDREELLVFEFKKKDCSMVRHCERRCSSFKRFTLFMIENYIPVYPGTMASDFLCKAIIKDHPKELVNSLLSSNCPSKFLQSMRYVYQQSSTGLPNRWVKNSDDADKYDKAVNLLNQKIEKDKADNLFTKFSTFTGNSGL